MSYEFKDVNNEIKNFFDEINKLGFKERNENCYMLGDMSIILNEFGEEDDTVMCCTKSSVFCINPVDIIEMNLRDTSSDYMKFFYVAFKTEHKNVCSFMCTVNIT